MAKSLTAPYAAGQRGFHWLKLKSAHTLDLVVLAVEWGSGRRKGWLSNLHLGARDPRSGQFVMLGKTFKGLTDEMLTWQTEKLLALEVEPRRVDGLRAARARGRDRVQRRPGVAALSRRASPCASRASSATGPTSRRPRPTPSRPCGRSSTSSASEGYRRDAHEGYGGTRARATGGRASRTRPRSPGRTSHRRRLPSRSRSRDGPTRSRSGTMAEA